MSSTSTALSSVVIYIGFPILVFGTLGNLLNIRLLWKNRRNPCACHFLASSFINCIVLWNGLFMRILSNGFQIDWSSTNSVWCKIHPALDQASFLMSLTCTCAASTDRFLASCRGEKLRKLSRLSIAIPTLILTILFWMSIFVPYGVYSNIVRNPYTGSAACLAIGSPTYANFYIYAVFPVSYGVMPSIILTITGLLTFKNTSSLQMGRQRQILQKQLTSMMLIQIPIILSTTLPFVAITEYVIFTAFVPKSANRLFIELLFSNIFSTTCYITFACPFFVFFASSTSFREDAKMLLLCRKTTAVTPMETNATTIVRTRQQTIIKIKQKPSNGIATIEDVESA